MIGLPHDLLCLPQPDDTLKEFYYNADAFCVTSSPTPRDDGTSLFFYIHEAINFVLCHQFKLLDTAQEIIDLDGVVNWLSNLNQVPDNYSIKALIKIIVKLGSLKPRKVRSYDVQVIMENALHENKIFANTDILDVHQDLPKLVAKRYFSREDPELMREVELDEVFPLNTEIAPANRDPESGSYRFEFVHSDTSEHVFRTVENMMRLAFQSGVNMQSVCIPLIKGPSGCGKTRMGAEAVTHGVNYLLRMNPPKNSERVFVEMLNRPELDSSLYCDTDTSGVSRINSLGYLVAILAFALRRQSDHPSDTLLIRLMKGYNNFSFDNFNVRLRQILKVPVLFLHLDEYRDDLVGTNALINLCAETLRYGPSDDVVRIFPIITGMTSYIDGDAVSDAFRRTSRRTSRLPHVMLFHLKGLGEFPACVENLESQFLQYLVQDVEGRPARANGLAWVRQREGNRDWPNLRPFLNDIDGYPRFYEFALRSISDSDKKDLLLTYAESDKILAIHQRLLRSMGYFFSQDTWASQVTNYICLDSDLVLEECVYFAIQQATIASLQMLLILAITEVKVPGTWTFGEIDTQWTGKVSLPLALLQGSHSGLYQVIGFPESSRPIGVEMPPLVIAALNKSAPIVNDDTLTCIPRHDPVIECMEALRVRLVARSYATGKTAVSLNTLREVFHESYIVHAYREEAQRSVKDVTLSSKDCFTKRLVIKNDFEEEEANVDNLPTFIATTIPHPQVNGVALISNEGIESRSTHPIMVGEEGFVLVVTVVVESNETEGHLARRIIGFLSDTAYTDSLTSKGLDWQYVIDLVAIDSTDQAPKFAIDSDFEKNVMEIVEEQCEGCLGVAKTIITPGLGQFPNAYRCNYSNN